jgi:CTP:molybdopterin cytidylyltransferase MocA
VSTRYGTAATYPLNSHTIIWENDEAASQRQWEETFVVEYYDHKEESWKVLNAHGFSFLEEAIKAAQRYEDTQWDLGDRPAVRVQVRYV